MNTMAELSPTAGESNYSQDIQVDEKLVPKKGLSLCSTRYGIALIIHVCNFIAAAQSTVINITMVAMVNTTDHQFQFNGSTEQLPGGPNNAPDSLPAEVAIAQVLPASGTKHIKSSSRGYHKGTSIGKKLCSHLRQAN
uniref:Solute carrier family 17 member 3 n=1 Tax=Canis lupus dingo TaxID=286419 RepID=A0A8C0QY59_CANLU